MRSPHQGSADGKRAPATLQGRAPEPAESPMYVLIVGGGKVGFYLAKTLQEHTHTIGIVEADRERCQALAEELGITAVCGDGTDVEILSDAGAEEASYVAAVTGRDEVNLAICQLVK